MDRVEVSKQGPASRDGQSAGLKAGTSHSSQVPVYKTHPSTLSLASSNLIAVPRLCHHVHAAHRQLARRVCGKHGPGMGSG